jgi:hypothetical protein
VGTDLVFATLTKLIAVGVHSSKRNVDWEIVRLLSYGSIPTAVGLLVIMQWWSVQGRLGDIIVVAVGYALLLTAVAMLARGALSSFGPRLDRRTAIGPLQRIQPALTVAAGALMGGMVTLTSIGAGALGTAMLVYLYPVRLTPGRLVGTDLAYAIPVALVAGVGHLLLGNFDPHLLAWLLVGSLPGAWLGARLAGVVSDRLLRAVIGIVLLAVGAKMLRLV